MLKNINTNIGELTRLAIEEQSVLASQCKIRGSLIQCVRENLAQWESQLFPLLKIQKKGRYEFLVDMLERAGYEGVSISTITTVVSRVRAEGRKSHE